MYSIHIYMHTPPTPPPPPGGGGRGGGRVIAIYRSQQAYMLEG